MNWYTKYIIISICLSVLIHSVFLSVILGLVLGFKEITDNSVPLKSLGLGIVLGIVMILITFYDGVFPDLAALLGIFRSLGFTISDNLSYSTIQFLSFAYILIFEVLILTISTKIGSMISTFLEKRQIHLIW